MPTMDGKNATDCDVVACDQPAAAPFVHVAEGHVLGFRICALHLGLMERGVRPAVVSDPSQGPAQRPALWMASAPDRNGSNA